MRRRWAPVVPEVWPRGVSEPGANQSGGVISCIAHRGLDARARRPSTVHSPPLQRLGESDVARVVGGDVRAQLECSTHQRPRGKRCERKVSEVIHGVLEPLIGHGASQPTTAEHSRRLDVDKIRCSKLSMNAEQLPGLPVSGGVVTHSVGQHRGIDDDHRRERSSARSAAA